MEHISKFFKRNNNNDKEKESNNKQLISEKEYIFTGSSSHCCKGVSALSLEDDCGRKSIVLERDSFGVITVRLIVIHDNLVKHIHCHSKHSDCNENCHRNKKDNDCKHSDHCLEHCNEEKKLGAVNKNVVTPNITTTTSNDKEILEEKVYKITYKYRRDHNNVYHLEITNDPDTWLIEKIDFLLDNSQFLEGSSYEIDKNVLNAFVNEFNHLVLNIKNYNNRYSYIAKVKTMSIAS